MTMASPEAPREIRGRSPMTLPIASASSSRKIDLHKWSIFSLLEPSFVASIKMACVFGNLGNEALVITEDDEVYGMGSNGASSLGLGTVNSSLFPLKVDKLCGIVRLRKKIFYFR